jgi:UPF0271 protein
MKRIIFDTAGFLAGLENLFPLVYTTPDVIEEVRDSNSVNLLNLSINSGKIIIQSPSKESVDYVIKTLHQIKESELSQTDISVIALAHELRPSIVFTDDLSVQNVLLYLNIEFNSVKLGFKMKNKKKVVYKCEACGRIFKKKYTECPYCGYKIVKIREK